MDEDYPLGVVMRDDESRWPAAEVAYRMLLWLRVGPVEWHYPPTRRAHAGPLRPQVNDPAGLVRSAHDTYSCSCGPLTTRRLPRIWGHQIKSFKKVEVSQ